MTEGERPDVLLLHDWALPLAGLEIRSSRRVPGYFHGTRPTPTRSLVEQLEPNYVFMGHMHSSRLEAQLGMSSVFGLSVFQASDPASWRSITFA